MLTIFCNDSEADGRHFIVTQPVMVDYNVSRTLIILLNIILCFSFRIRPLPRFITTIRKVVPTNSVPSVPDRVLIRDGTYVRPSDYVSHTTYGVGQYIRSHGILISHVEAAEKKYAPGMVVRFLDGEVLWFQRIAAEELFLFKMGEAGQQTLYSLLNFSKWNVRLKKAQRDSEEIAKNLLETQRLRSGAYRTPYPPDGEEYRLFEKQFKHTATKDQQACFEEIAFDMINRTSPMDRLVCGDVGFGKTEVAIRTAYRAVLAGYQVAVLAPTRILATQHVENFRERMPGINIQLLRGQMGTYDRTKIDIADGTCQIVIGTHAILQPSVKFQNLSVLIIDEEQKFGVIHKEVIKQTFPTLDILTLSATPIPRTLQISLQNIRQMSKLLTPPSQRKQVTVTLVPDQFVYNYSTVTIPDEIQPNMEEAESTANKPSYQEKLNDDNEETTRLISKIIHNELKRGGQLYVVVPFISDLAIVEQRILEVAPEARIIHAHGKLPNLLENVQQFREKKADILLATTVIENGIDVPNANTILVFKADCFGMSALYQLKGRVGRGSQQAHAYFFHCPVNSLSDIKRTARLQSLITHQDLGAGIRVAQDDLVLRGCGNLEGEEQAGHNDVGHAMLNDLIDKSLKKEMENKKSVADS